MNVEVRGKKDVKVTQRLQEHAEKKLSKLDKFIDDSKTAQVMLSSEGDAFKVEVTIPLNGIILRGEEINADKENHRSGICAWI